MNLDEAGDSAAAQIDAILEQRLDAMTLRMIACGVEEDIVADLIADQRAIDAIWRARALVDVRERLATW